MPMGLGLMMVDRFPGGVGTTIIHLTTANLAPYHCGQPVSFFCTVRSSTGTPIAVGYVAIFDNVSNKQIGAGYLTNGQITFIVEFAPGTYQVSATYHDYLQNTQMIYNNLPDATSNTIGLTVSQYSGFTLSLTGIFSGEPGAPSYTGDQFYTTSDFPIGEHANTIMPQALLTTDSGTTASGTVTYTYTSLSTSPTHPTPTFLCPGPIIVDIAGGSYPYPLGNQFESATYRDVINDYVNSPNILPQVLLPIISGAPSYISYGLEGIVPNIQPIGGVGTLGSFNLQASYEGEGHWLNKTNNGGFPIYDTISTYYCKSCTTAVDYLVKATSSVQFSNPPGGPILGVTLFCSFAFSGTDNLTPITVTVVKPVGFPNITLNGSVVNVIVSLNGNVISGGQCYVSDENSTVNIQVPANTQCLSCPPTCCPAPLGPEGYCSTGPGLTVACKCNVVGLHFGDCDTCPPSGFPSSVCCDNTNVYSVQVIYQGNSFFQGGATHMYFLTCAGACQYAQTCAIGPRP